MNEFYEPQQPYPTYDQPPIQATVNHEYRRPPIKWSALAPYLVACAAVAVATATLFMFFSWRGSMQAQVNQLRHQVAVVQAQAAGAADSGQSQINGLSRSVKGLRTDVNAIAALVGPFTSQCTTDLTGPSGPAAYLFLCRQQG